MNLKTSKGFTIVELLIVIVVIAILAAISIVAFSGIQNRAKTSSGQQLANQVEKKAVAYNAIKSSYPANYAAFAEEQDSALEGISTSNLVVGEIPGSIDAAAADGGKNVFYNPCANNEGARIAYWDFTKGALSDVKVLGKCS